MNEVITFNPYVHLGIILFFIVGLPSLFVWVTGKQYVEVKDD